MESMIEKAETQAVDLVGAWEKGNVNQREELAKSFFQSDSSTNMK